MRMLSFYRCVSSLLLFDGAAVNILFTISLMKHRDALPFPLFNVGGRGAYSRNLAAAASMLLGSKGPAGRF